jgi:hypothetical protein
VVVRVDDGGGPLPGALGAGAVTVCRVLTVRLAVLGKFCDFSDEILRTPTWGHFRLPMSTLDPLRPVANSRFGALKFRRYELQSPPPQLWMVGLYRSWLI